MNKLKTIILTFAIVPSISLAGTNMPNKTIKNVIVNLATGIHFQINESMSNSENCDSNSWFKIESDSKYEKEALSLLLTYEAQNKPITFYLENCTGGYPKVKYIH